PATTVLSTISLHDALPIYGVHGGGQCTGVDLDLDRSLLRQDQALLNPADNDLAFHVLAHDRISRRCYRSCFGKQCSGDGGQPEQDRKSTRLNSSHVKISYA